MRRTIHPSHVMRRAHRLVCPAPAPCLHLRLDESYSPAVVEAVTDAAVAARLGLDAFYFVYRHILYVFPAIAVLLVMSCLTPRTIRRLALLMFVASLILVVMTLFYGAEVKGARRWIVIMGVNIQPSEFLKPAFGFALHQISPPVFCAAWDVFPSCGVFGE